MGRVQEGPRGGTGAAGVVRETFKELRKVATDRRVWKDFKHLIPSLSIQCVPTGHQAMVRPPPPHFWESPHGRAPSFALTLSGTCRGETRTDKG